MGKAFEKQIKTVEIQGKKQVDVLKELKDNKEKQIKAIKDKTDDKLSIPEKNFNKLLDERMDGIQKMSDEINLKDLTYYFTCPNPAPINFIGFRGRLNIYNDIKIGNISIKAVEEDQKKFKPNLSEITARNPKYRKKYQSGAITNIKNFYNSRQIYLMIMLKLDLKLCTKQKMEQDLKY